MPSRHLDGDRAVAGGTTAPRRLARFARATHYVTYSQACFFITIAVCIVLMPGAAAHHDGLSDFGIHERTVVPYVAGLLLTGYFMIKAAHALPQNTRTLKFLTEALFALAVLVVGVSLTPYSVDALFDWAHIGASSVLFLDELVLAVWLVFAHVRGRLNFALLAAQLAAALVAFYSELGVLDRMLTGEIATQVAFGILLIRCLHRLTQTPEP